MKKYWVAFAIIPISCLLSVEMAKSDECSVFSRAQSLRIRDLKDVSCQIYYKLMYDDLQNKYILHQRGLYRMPASETVKYQKSLDNFIKVCVPEDPIVDKIERNEMPVDVNWP